MDATGTSAVGCRVSRRAKNQGGRGGPAPAPRGPGRGAHSGRGRRPTEVWPAHAAIWLGLAPTAIHSDTAVCRRSCGRRGSRPAARTAGPQCRARQALERRAPPSPPGKTRESASSPQYSARWASMASATKRGIGTVRCPTRVLGGRRSVDPGPPRRSRPRARAVQRGRAGLGAVPPARPAGVRSTRRIARGRGTEA